MLLPEPKHEIKLRKTPLETEEFLFVKKPLSWKHLLIHEDM